MLCVCVYVFKVDFKLDAKTIKYMIEKPSLLLKMFIYFDILSELAGEGQRKREGEKGSQAGSAPSVQSPILDPTTVSS